MDNNGQKKLNQSATFRSPDFQDKAFKALLEGFCSYCNPNKTRENSCVHIDFDDLIVDNNNNNNSCEKKKH